MPPKKEKEHGPHPMALLREWKLDLNPTIKKQAKTELEHYKLADLLTCLLLHSPALNAGKIRFTAGQSQLAKVQGVSKKTIYTRLKRLESMGVITWEQPKTEDGSYKSAVFTVSRCSVSKKDDAGDPREARVNDAPVSKQLGVPSVEFDGTVSKKQESTDGEVTDTGLKVSGHSGHDWSEEQDDTTDASRDKSKTTPTPKAYQIEDSDEPVGPKVPVHPVLNTPVSAAPRKRLPVAHFHNYLNDHDWIPARLGPVCSRCGKDKEEVKMSRDPEPCELGDEVEMPKSRAFDLED